MINTDPTAELIACAREPIHSPGSIQPHGIMLVVDVEDLMIRHVAGDIEMRLGMPDPIGERLATVIGRPLERRVGDLCGPAAPTGGFMGRMHTFHGQMMDVSAYRSLEHLLVELEPAATEDLVTAFVLDALAAGAAGFERAGTVGALCESAASAFRELTGFDRVMVYRFNEDGSGEVVAEALAPGQRGFLHQHFPESDVPKQARALYLRNRIRVIPERAYEPARLRPAWTGSIALDMSDASLRSVSSIHLQYLSNMGVRASASISIVCDGMLWGLVACHNDSARALSYDLRAACRSLAGSLGRQIKAKEEAEGFRRTIRHRSYEDDIVRSVGRDDAVDETLSNHLTEIGLMLDADGVAVLLGSALMTGGACPAEKQIRDLAAWIRAGTGEPAFITDCLSALFEPAGSYREYGSGVLAVTLSNAQPWMVICFRAEQAQTIEWAGNPHKSTFLGEPGALAPRASFEAWRETVEGRARAWSKPEIDAALRLRSALLDIQQSRRVLMLAHQLAAIVKDKDELLRQKAFLISEVNHRVQNSLQLVSSFLDLQARASNSIELNIELDEARRRLAAVALVHRRLYVSDQIQTVDAARYIEELCTETLSFMGRSWAQHLHLNLASATISTDRAVPLGLVLTELMININKYAYGGTAGPVEISLVEGPTHLHLVVADKGRGGASPSSGFGARIIRGLVQQLGGELHYTDNRPGLRVQVTLPLKLPGLT